MIAPKALVITLNGAGDIRISVDGAFIDLVATVRDDDDPSYTGPITTTIINGAGSTITRIPTDAAATFTVTYGAPENDGNVVIEAIRTVNIVTTVDTDGDLLIDIFSLDQLNNIRHNLDGTFYTTTAGATSGMRCESAADTTCQGYELMQNLDFAAGNSYASGTVNDEWRPQVGGTVVEQSMAGSATNAGWPPIGDCRGDDDDMGTNACGDTDDDRFFTLFEGNGNHIANLYVRDTVIAIDNGIGFFGLADPISSIRNFGLATAAVYGRGDLDSIGALLGESNGSITASYATDVMVSGSGGSEIYVGGLVGFIADNFLTASYATGDVAVDGANSNVGGLVGNALGTISASYATVLVAMLLVAIRIRILSVDWLGI